MLFTLDFFSFEGGGGVGKHLGERGGGGQRVINTSAGSSAVQTQARNVIFTGFLFFWGKHFGERGGGGGAEDDKYISRKFSSTNKASKKCYLRWISFLLEEAWGGWGQMRMINALARSLEIQRRKWYLYWNLWGYCQFFKGFFEG